MKRDADDRQAPASEATASEATTSEATTSEATASEATTSEATTSDVFSGTDEVAQRGEIDGTGETQVEYWVPSGDQLVPASPEEIARFQEWERESIMRVRLKQWSLRDRRRSFADPLRRPLGDVLASLIAFVRRPKRGVERMS